MKLSSNVKSAIFEAACLLYIFLLVYAAMNKGLDFEKFKVELGQSPLLSAFAGWISWVVLAIEFSIAFFLLFRKTRAKALYAGFCLMSMFTAYIFIMLNFSSFLPCSCGGILEKMSWKQHLLFNIFFVLLGAWALGLQNGNSKNRRFGFSYGFGLLLSVLASTVVVLVLFLSSEEIMQHQNPFIRRYPHHPATLTDMLDLKYNSYYFAGSGNGHVYLGNLTVPLYLLSIDSLLHQRKIRIALDQSSFTFKEIKINVDPPFFYLTDGRTPAVFKGTVDNWKAELQHARAPYFTNAVPIDSFAVAFNGISSRTGDNTLGIFRFGSQPKAHMAPELLQKQIDGVFDTEGMLHYSQEMKRIIYLYSYRNQYIVADQNGRLDYRGNTIDTISKAQVKVAYLKGRTERTMSIPALNVNKTSSVCGHLLFVNSNVPGRYEQREVWKQASVIDVYDLRRKSYLLSFHIYGIGDQKLRSFMITPTHAYALIGSQLAVYSLGAQIRKEMGLNGIRK